MKAYLAGAIRSEEDYKWRAELSALHGERLTALIPPDILTDEKNDLKTGEEWFKTQRFRPGSYMTYKTDLKLIDEADLFIGNFLALAEGYPCIGSLVEMGYARGLGKHILIVAPPEYKRHPFISYTAAGAFDTIEELNSYLTHYLDTMEGKCPFFMRL